MKRKTIYAAMTGGFGSLSQVLPILERLDKTKFRILYSIAHGAAHALQRLGYQFILYPDIGQSSHVTPKGRIWCDLDHYWGRFGYADEEYFQRLIASRLKIIHQIKPDLLLTQFCPPTEVAARITKLPIICVTQSCWHPMGKSISWWRKKVGNYPKVTPIVNSIFEKYGAKSIGRMEDLNKGNLTIIPSFPEFDPVNDQSAFFTGPLTWGSSTQLNSSFDWDFPKLFSKPIILVYTGHLYDSAGKSGILILKRVVKALRDAPFNVIVTTGFDQKISFEKYVAPNIFLFDWIPLNDVIKRCRLFIHHGGHGSCMAAILNGIPSLVIPTFQEREFNARQLQLLGLGDFVLPTGLTISILRQKIQSCLNNQSILHNLRYWQTVIKRRNYDGARQAAALINELAFNM